MKTAQSIPVPDWMAAPETRAVTDALGAKGAVVRFVGGCVRDTLLGRAVADIDLATPDPPETVTALLKKAGL
ncbi:MAG: CCA tRNA nucleotidyltransferase, partial [Alphaproteobacteria bacterium]|nr:CCA tRNA nucleotidyltransferase [Alphaproteobacteria bacterium]